MIRFLVLTSVLLLSPLALITFFWLILLYQQYILLPFMTTLGLAS